MVRKLLGNVFSSKVGLSMLMVRVCVGLTFMAHGSQKLFGFFGGGGLAGTAKYMSSLGLEPGVLMALLSGSSEFFGGMFFILGFLVRPAAISLFITMIVAIATVHIGNGFFIQKSGFEYAFILAIVCVLILIQGAGKWSLDNIVSKALSNK